jgi:hypothetical protein
MAALPPPPGLLPPQPGMMMMPMRQPPLMGKKTNQENYALHKNYGGFSQICLACSLPDASVQPPARYAKTAWGVNTVAQKDQQYFLILPSRDHVCQYYLKVCSFF